MTNKPWVLYVLECSDKTLYTGITTDLERRVEEHNGSDKGAKFTRARRPVRCVYTQEFEDRSTATKAEIAFKKFSRSEKLNVISTKIFNV